MTDTVIVAAPVGTWTVVLAASLTGLISNEGPQRVLWREGTVAPIDTITKGHTLNPGARETRTTAVGQEIYVRGIIEPGSIAVTSA